MTINVYGFFMPGCRFCSDFIPAFQVVMSSFNPSDKSVIWHNVTDATTKEGSDQMDEFGLKHMFPTVIVEDSNGTIHQYNRTSDTSKDFSNFVNKFIK